MTQGTKNTKDKVSGFNAVFDSTVTVVKFVRDFFYEFGYGFKHRSYPFGWCNFLGITLLISTTIGLDKALFTKSIGLYFYPKQMAVYTVYVTALALAGYWLYCLYRIAVKNRLKRDLLTSLANIGLKNQTGTFPTFVSDFPKGTGTRVLRLNKNYVSYKQFVENKAEIESALQIFIDDIKDRREQGSIDIVYAFDDLEQRVNYRDLVFTKTEKILIGKTRSSIVSINLNSVPHFLIAGETSSGKSTFLRQMIATLYVNNPSYQFNLIDLKGGLEFQVFEGYDRIEVQSSAEAALLVLTNMNAELDTRLAKFKAAKVKDIKTYRKTKYASENPVARKIVVIDEATELFLTGAHIKPEQVKKARSIVSRIARLGRALGLHVIIGTQRPDARALDTQIKANLGGKICFQMANNTSSVIVLDSARAADLPKIPGRAIWQCGMDTYEVQTPFLDTPDVRTLLGPPKEQTETSKELATPTDTRTSV